MSSVFLVLLGAGLVAMSGFPALLMSSRSAAGQRASVALLVSGSAIGLAGAAWALASPEAADFAMGWALPIGAFSVSVDPLSAFFLFPAFLVPAIGAVYGLSYWKQAEHPENGRRLGFFYGLLSGGMATVIVARDAVLFLIAWEIMALSAYFAATAESDKAEVRKAGWIYLVATHAGTLALIAMFGLWRGATGSFALLNSPGLAPGAAGAIFILALVGFGFKAGFMPLHVWLPGAHANAPSHVSALMSGAMLKLGVYGIVRMTGLMDSAEPWWGFTLLAVGALSAVLGIAFACGQSDMKRMLAYSSIENLGIIAMGIGLALLGAAYDRPELMLLGMGGALLHVWNHGLFKSLLFLGSGAVIHAAGTRDVDLMGGLGKKMPKAAFLFAVGAVAICALPPLNGFSGEWLLYLGLFRALDPANTTGLALAGSAAAALALAGALALAAFVKLYGSVFLGEARSESSGHVREPGKAMLVPMGALAFGCFAIGLAPALAAPLAERALRAWAPPIDEAISISTFAPLGWISLAGAGLAAILGALFLWRRSAGRKRAAAEAGTWDCGYARPTARMQYTGSSLSQSVVKMFSFALWPRTRISKPSSAFPDEAAFESRVPDAALERIVLPVFDFFERLLARLRFFQQGQTYLYVLYVALITIALFLFNGTGAGL